MEKAVALSMTRMPVLVAGMAGAGPADEARGVWQMAADDSAFGHVTMRPAARRIWDEAPGI